MSKEQMETDSDPEITAIASVYKALKDLEIGAQERVLRYVAGKLGVSSPSTERNHVEQGDVEQVSDASMETSRRSSDVQVTQDAEGISPVAIKWMRRSGLKTSDLSGLFSLGGDEIDLVAETVPGKGKKVRMHTVVLLKGIAAYLGSGAPRVTHDQIKEACLHYDAFDGPNFASYLKSFAAELSGGKKTGFTLTPRGLTRATETIKQILASKAAGASK